MKRKRQQGTKALVERDQRAIREGALDLEHPGVKIGGRHLAQEHVRNSNPLSKKPRFEKRLPLPGGELSFQIRAGKFFRAGVAQAIGGLKFDY